MRQAIACVFLAVSTFLLANCVYSVHPLEQGKPSVVASNMVGTWTAKNKDGKLEVMSIEEPAPGEYEATYTEPDDERPIRYKVRLMRVGKIVFADAQLMGEVKGKTVEDLPGGAAALHMFFKVSLGVDQFGVSPMDQQWLEKQFDMHKFPVAHEDLDDDTTILTAQPPQLQKFLLEVSADGEAFSGNTLFTRQK